MSQPEDSTDKVRAGRVPKGKPVIKILIASLVLIVVAFIIIGIVNG